MSVGKHMEKMEPYLVHCWWNENGTVIWEKICQYNRQPSETAPNNP